MNDKPFEHSEMPYFHQNTGRPAQQLKLPDSLPMSIREQSQGEDAIARQQVSPNKSVLKEKLMSIISNAAIPTSTTPPTPLTSLQTYFKERRPEVQQLKDALQSGDLAAAEQAYNNLVALGNNVLHKDNPFLRSDRGSDFNAIGKALQNGDLAGARQAFAALQETFERKVPPAAGTTPAAALPAAVVNLISATPEISSSLSSAGGSTTAAKSGVDIVA